MAQARASRRRLPASALVMSDNSHAVAVDHGPAHPAGEQKDEDDRRGKDEPPGNHRSDLGRRLGLSWQAVQKYEKGEIRIGASRLQQISHILRAHRSTAISSSRGHFVEREREARSALAVSERGMLTQLANKSFRAGYVRFGNFVDAGAQVPMRSDFPAPEAFLYDHIVTPFSNGGERSGCRSERPGHGWSPITCRRSQSGACLPNRARSLSSFDFISKVPSVITTSSRDEAATRRLRRSRQLVSTGVLCRKASSSICLTRNSATSAREMNPHVHSRGSTNAR